MIRSYHRQKGKKLCGIKAGRVYICDFNCRLKASVGTFYMHKYAIDAWPLKFNENDSFFFFIALMLLIVINVGMVFSSVFLNAYNQD